MTKTTDLSTYDKTSYNPGSFLRRAAWFLVNILFFINPLNPFYGLKRGLLRGFGARVGVGVVIKPSVRIKYPWMLEIGNHVWIGEQVWIDNLAPVKIGDHCCLSQGALLLCGNHDYTRSTFDLLVESIVLEDGVWIGARSTVAPGVRCKSHAVLALQSVATSDLEAYTVYRGNPAQKVKDRIIA